ncbi:MAG: hypothetical protein ACI4ST_07375 [Candidatus Gallimonas sp.]
MATEKERVMEILEGLSEVRAYPMMGDYVVYCRERAVGCICDGNLFVKKTPSSRRMLEGAPELPPYVGAKPRYLVEDTDKAFLQELFFSVAEEVPAPKRK